MHLLLNLPSISDPYKHIPYFIAACHKAKRFEIDTFLSQGAQEAKNPLVWGELSNIYGDLHQ